MLRQGNKTLILQPCHIYSVQISDHVLTNAKKINCIIIFHFPQCIISINFGDDNGKQLYFAF